MSEEAPIPEIKKDDTEEVKKLKGRLLKLIEAGKNPADSDNIAKKLAEAKTVNVGFQGDFTIDDKERILNQENFDKLMKRFEDLGKYTSESTVNAQRKEILDEIKALDEDTYEAEKENKTINELQTALRTAKRIKPSGSKRDVGAKDKGDQSESPNTQYDHLLKKFVPG